ncbi:TetR/AcrR family transcriptional regulator [Kaistia sp. MMO-174]|uniref:TetR/AcrR family transcriptional regulator n=1 Tax=Kaistia sp. MMO-174 TaxID=3081256 RepID=UPI001AC19C3B|nr:TetR family transcriptional regulator [Hyphomicrobiales bacterium]MBN9058446.1 TetR family transcriptional regulator [Hyphomicrobiales bacterium]
MTSAHERKKQPEQVRRRLLDCAASLAVETGLASLTIQAVADAADVTKGGLFHHFASKEKLIEGVFTDLLDKLDAEIDAILAADPVVPGRFTRAYVDSAIRLMESKAPSPWGALSISMMTDPALRRLWSDWYRARLARHADTDSAPMLEIVRYAADGIWLSDLCDMDPALRMDRAVLRDRLIRMTTEPERSPA